MVIIIIIVMPITSYHQTYTRSSMQHQHLRKRPNNSPATAFLFSCHGQELHSIMQDCHLTRIMTFCVRSLVGPPHPFRIGPRTGSNAAPAEPLGTRAVQKSNADVPFCLLIYHRLIAWPIEPSCVLTVHRPLHQPFHASF